MKKVRNVLFGIAAAAFVGFFVFIFAVSVFTGSVGEDEMFWRVFSVCMPLSGACLISGAVLSVIDFIRKL